MTVISYILGIHDGHNCGASLSANGKIIASISEERLTRKKNEVGYPVKSIEEVIRIGGISVDEIDTVAYASLFMHEPAYLTDLQSWYCVGIEEQRIDMAKPEGYQKVIFARRKAERIDAVINHLSVPSAKIMFVEHHLAHLAAAYYSAPKFYPSGKFLGLTCDGAGDGLAGTVSICQGNTIDRIATINRHASLGKLYSRTTMLMGMKPWEHEYKLMGLAPYADIEAVHHASKNFAKLLGLSDDGLSFAMKSEVSMNYSYRTLREVFERVRFDTIAGAIQHFTEDLLVKWVKKCIQKTGISDIVAGGGVFMNVKANMLIADIPEVTSFYVMPSAADESLSIGACLHAYYQKSDSLDHASSVFEHLYFGPEHSLREEKLAIEKTLAHESGYEIRQLDEIEEVTASLLSDGEIVARCAGPMEWGARALGNRSILASGQDYRVVEELNNAIKQRDFWMPFAPAIKSESSTRYLDNPKNSNTQFMTSTFRTSEEARKDLAAGTHPRDQTVRAQAVSQTSNYNFHKLLSFFEEKTGRSGLVNTSFNLHGEPIVNSPQDAIRVLKKSGLKHLALGHFFISKTSS